jgi:hypothetical protein
MEKEHEHCRNTEQGTNNQIDDMKLILRKAIGTQHRTPCDAIVDDKS